MYASLNIDIFYSLPKYLKYYWNTCCVELKPDSDYNICVKIIKFI